MADEKRFLDEDGLKALWDKHNKVQPFFYETGTAGTAGWVNFLTVKCKAYMNQPLVVRLLGRGYSDCTMEVQFNSVDSLTPSILYFKQRIQPYSGSQAIPKPGYTFEDVSGTRYFKFWMKKNEGYGSISVHAECSQYYTTGGEGRTGLLTYPNTQSDTEPSGIVYATVAWESVPEKTAVAAAAKKIGMDKYGQVVIGDSLAPSDLGISATTTSVTVGSTTANIPQATSTSPKMDGTAAVGTETTWAKGDHVHPTDTSRAPKSHASSADTYGLGTTSNYGHVKLATGDMNGATHADGVAVSKNHTHSQYVPTTRTVNGHALSSDVTVTASDISAVRYDTASQGLTDTQKSNARTNIGAGTSNLAIGTTATTAAAGNHTHTTTLATDSGTATVELAHATTYKLTAGGTSVIFKTPADNNTDTKVKATAKTDDANYKILATASASPTSGNATEAVYDADISLNPSTNTISANVSGNAATATKLAAGKELAVSLSNTSTTTTFDGSANVTNIKTTGTLGVGNGGTGMTTATYKNAVVIGNSSTVTNAMQTVRTGSGAFYATAQDGKPQFGTLPIAQGGTGATDAGNARTNLSVYSKSEVDSMLGGRIEVVASLPATGQAGVVYYVGPTGSGSDQYDEYIWSNNAFIKVGEHSLDLSNYVNTVTTSGSGSVVTGVSKSGNTVTVTKGNIAINNLSDWASNSDVAVGGVTYHTWWPTSPTSSNQVYGLSMYNGKLYQVYNNKGTYSVRSYDQDNDTTYTNASLGQGYGTCSTAQATAAKEVTLADYALTKGGIVAVKFTNGLCASATLNVDSKGAKAIYINGAAVTADTAGTVGAGDLAYFMYDGSVYHLLGTDRAAVNPIINITRSGTTFTATRLNGKTFTFTQQDSDTQYTQEKLGQGYGTCTTAEATAAKVVALTNYELVTNGIVAVKFSYPLCAAATLNINSRGAKPVYIGGAAVTSTNCKSVQAGDIGYFIYDGTAYHFLGTDRAGKSSITGLSVSGKTVTYTRADGETGTFDTQDTTYAFADSYNASTNKGATVATVTNAINALDVSDISGFGAGKTLATLTETNGKIAATFQNISITKSQVSDFSHTHGNITNGGALQTTDITIADGDKLVVTDASDSNKIARASLTFDGATTNQMLSKKGDWSDTIAKARAVVDYGATSKAIEIGWSGAAVTSPAYFAVYTDSANGYNKAIKDCSLANVKKVINGTSVGSTAVPVFINANGAPQVCTDDFVHDGDVTSTYSSTGTAPVNGTAVASAISSGISGKLDRNNTSTVLIEPSQTNSGVYLILGQYSCSGYKNGSKIDCYSNVSATITIESRHSGCGTCVISSQVNNSVTPTESSPSIPEGSYTGHIYVYGNKLDSARNSQPIKMYRKYTVNAETGIPTWTITLIVNCGDYNNFKIANILHRNGVTLKTGSIPTYASDPSYYIASADLSTLGTEIASAQYLDHSVTQTADNSSTGTGYEVLFSATADNTTRTEGARKSNKLTFQPSTGTLTATKFSGALAGNASTASAAQSGSALETAINGKAPTNHASTATTYGVGTDTNYGHVKLDNSTPLGVSSTNIDGVATGRGHKHNNLESVPRGSVTTVDVDHSNYNTRAHMMLYQVSSSTSSTHKPADGYMLTFLWDTGDPYDAQVFMPVDSTRDFGRLKIRYRDNKSSWGEWGYLPAAQNAGLITNSSDLDTFKGTTHGDIAAYRWVSSNAPTGATLITGSGNAPSATMIVIKTHTGNYTTQVVYTADKGIYSRYYNSSTWSNWEKILKSGDIIASSTNGAISVNGSDITVYTHPTDAGNKHIPAGGSSGQFLGWDSAGTAKWVSNPNTNTVPSAYCETAAGTAAKVASCTNYTATANTYLHVLMRYANSSTGALTLNVNGQGNKPIYIDDAVSSSSNYTLPAGTYIVFYDGTNYWFRTDGKIQAQITGSAGFADGIYNRSAMSGDGWFKIAESKLAPRTNSDVAAVWDVTFAGAGGGTFYEKLCLDVRFNSSGDGVLSRFVRTYEVNKTASLKFAVLISGTGGSGDTQVQLWAWLENTYCSVAVRQVAGSNWALQKYNKVWTYYSSTTGGTTKPVADAANHISVSDSTNVHMRDASFINAGTLPVSRGGTGMSTATNKNAVVIGNSTTVTDAMQTVRTGNGAFYATAQDAKPTFGTLPIAQGGTGATTRLNALKALTNENVGTNATYFLTITNSWGKGGYTSVADTKSVLGINDTAAFNNSASCYGILIAELTVSTNVETAEFIAKVFVDANFGIKNYSKETTDLKFIFRNNSSSGSYSVWYADAEHRFAHDSSERPVYFAYKTDANKAYIYLLWGSDGSVTSGTYRVRVQTYSKFGCASISYPGTALSERLTGFTNFTEKYVTKSTYRTAVGGTNAPVYVDAYGEVKACTTYANATVGTANKLGTADKGSSTKPIYLAAGVPTECSTYAGGTAVTLNNASKAGSTASFYAPTAGGTANYVLIGNGTTSAPTWAEKAPKASVADYLNQMHTNEVNFKNVPTSGSNIDRVWFNYRNGDTDAKDSGNLITGYYFGNRNGVTTGVTLYADNFSGTSANSNNTKVTTATTTKTYLAGANATGYTSGAQTSLLTDTGIYATTTAGELNATQFKVNEHCTMQYNSTKSSLDFVFS